MVAGNRAPRRRQPAGLGAAMPQIHHVACPVQAAIATVDHQIRVGGTGLTDHGVPVGPRPRRGPRQVSAGTRITRAAATPQSLPARLAA
jgi:hypothetical protein